jgi:NhaC family Na+:H+ antiporter
MNKQLTFPQSLVIIFSVFALLFVSLLFWKTEPHMPLLAATVIAAVLLRCFGVCWAQMETAMLRGIQSAFTPMLILLLIGILISVWMMSGTIPTILSYGIAYIQPQYFAVSALVLTVIVSTLTGSSFTTVSTVGVALMGIAAALGVDPFITAGAVICGACFGDKMSPLSDTTTFASAVADVPLFTHVRSMARTSIPALFISAVCFFLWERGGAADMSQISAIQQELSRHFTLHWLTLLSPLTVIVCSIKRKPILPTLVAGIVTGLLVAALVQQETSPARWFQVMQHGFHEKFANETVASIVNRGGLLSMTWPLSLILIALALGGLLQHCGVFSSLFHAWMTRVKRGGHVIWLAGSSSILVNGLTGEQYLSIVLPGQMFRTEFERRGMERRILSRTLEDCGTLVNPLIPWSVSGAFFTSTLHVSTVEYLPYALFLWLSPLLTFSYALRHK